MTAFVTWRPTLSSWPESAETKTAELIRRNYFEITNRWLDCVLACDVGVGTRDELLGVVEPLPLLTPEGELR